MNPLQCSKRHLHWVHVKCPRLQSDHILFAEFVANSREAVTGSDFFWRTWYRWAVCTSHSCSESTVPRFEAILPHWFFPPTDESAWLNVLRQEGVILHYIDHHSERNGHGVEERSFVAWECRVPSISSQRRCWYRRAMCAVIWTGRRYQDKHNHRIGTCQWAPVLLSTVHKAKRLCAENMAAAEHTGLDVIDWTMNHHHHQPLNHCGTFASCTTQPSNRLDFNEQNERAEDIIVFEEGFKTKAVEYSPPATAEKSILSWRTRPLCCSNFSLTDGTIKTRNKFSPDIPWILAYISSRHLRVPTDSDAGILRWSKAGKNTRMMGPFVLLQLSVLSIAGIETSNYDPSRAGQLFLSLSQAISTHTFQYSTFYSGSKNLYLSEDPFQSQSFSWMISHWCLCSESSQDSEGVTLTRRTCRCRNPPPLCTAAACMKGLAPTVLFMYRWDNERYGTGITHPYEIPPAVSCGRGKGSGPESIDGGGPQTSTAVVRGEHEGSQWGSPGMFVSRTELELELLLVLLDASDIVPSCSLRPHPPRALQ